MNNKKMTGGGGGQKKYKRTADEKARSAVFYNAFFVHGFNLLCFYVALYSKVCFCTHGGSK